VYSTVIVVMVRRWASAPAASAPTANSCYHPYLTLYIISPTDHTFFKGERTAAEMTLLLTYGTCIHPLGTEDRYMYDAQRGLEAGGGGEMPRVSEWSGKNCKVL
jgi:hypothetical protein